MKTMKIMRRLMGCAAAILALSACSESEDLLSAFHSDPNAVRITAQVGKASADGFTRSNPLGATEADQKKFNDGDMISVKADGQDAVTYQLNNNEWQPQGNKFLKWESETMNFTAYYPATFDGNITQPTEYNSLESLAAADFMSFRGEQSNTNKSNQLTLVMNRMMARVIVEIAGFNDQYTKNATVNSLSICGVKAYKHETDGKFYALIDPNYTTSTAPFLSLEVADGESKTTEKYTTPTTFVAGNSYTYKLTVGKNKISVSGITVKDWTTSKTIIDGKAEQIIRYVTFTAEAEQKFKMTTKNYPISGLQYSVNGGDWKDVEAGTEVPFGGTKGNLRLRGTNTNGTASGLNAYSTITFTNKNVNVTCTGDIRTLLDWRNYSTVDTQKAKFCNLFRGCTSLTAAPELKATTLADYCYSNMFRGCTSLTSAPELPATTLANNCYTFMFYGCTSLTAAPELKATTLADGCYYIMFYGCTKLSTVTMLAPSDQISKASNCCYKWLYKAGTGETVTSRTLKVMDADAYTALEGDLPDIWCKGTAGTTVLYENNSK